MKRKLLKKESEGEEEKDIKKRKLTLFDEEEEEEGEKEVEKDIKKSDKKSAKRKKQKEQKRERVDDLKSLCLDSNVFVGLDLSSTSPAMTILWNNNSIGNNIKMMAFAQTQKQEKAKTNKNDDNNNVELKLQPMMKTSINNKNIDKNKNNNNKLLSHDALHFNKIDLIVETFLKEILLLLDGKEKEKEKIIVGIEASIFHQTQSSSMSKLYELGAVMRYQLMKHGIAWREISPTTIKKWFTGYGSADKPQMWKHFQENYKIPLDKWIPGTFNTIIPSPHNDLVDSFALAGYLSSLKNK